jgi:hypothetical protein
MYNLLYNTTTTKPLIPNKLGLAMIYYITVDLRFYESEINCPKCLSNYSFFDAAG